MAIMPHCVACGFDKGYQQTHAVAFANHIPGSGEPTNEYGHPILGWSNELGVTAPTGVGLFCDAHLARATELHHLTSVEAITILTAEPVRRAHRRGMLAAVKLCRDFPRVLKKRLHVRRADR